MYELAKAYLRDTLLESCAGGIGGDGSDGVHKGSSGSGGASAAAPTSARMAARVRAAGSACGANPLAVVVPCHRVLRTGDGLGGYAWGLERKKALTERERG